MPSQSFQQEFKLFLSSNQKNAWIYFDEGSIYLRKSKRNNPRPCSGIENTTFIDFIDLANVQMNTPRQGDFTRILNWLEQQELNLMVESVLDAWFADWLERRNYLVVSQCRSVTLPISLPVNAYRLGEGSAENARIGGWVAPGELKAQKT
jgi:hypothetical protein